MMKIFQILSELSDVYDSKFSRILNLNLEDTERMLVDTPAVLAGGSEYIGIATATALTTDPVWAIVKVIYDANGRISSRRVLLLAKWADRATLTF